MDHDEGYQLAIITSVKLVRIDHRKQQEVAAETLGFSAPSCCTAVIVEFGQNESPALDQISTFHDARCHDLPSKVAIVAVT